MSFSVEDNFVVLGRLVFEDREDEQSVKFQIQVEKLFTEEDLFAGGLVGCSSGIKREYASRNYAINENLGYYFHETINMNHYAVRSISNGIKDFQIIKFETTQEADAKKYQNFQEIRYDNTELLSTISRKTIKSYQKHRAPLLAAQNTKIRPFSAVVHRNLDKENFESATLSSKTKENDQGDISTMNIKKPARDGQKLEKHLPLGNKEGASGINYRQSKEDNAHGVTRDNKNNETRGNENDEGAANLEHQARDLISSSRNESEALEQVQSERDMEPKNFDEYEYLSSSNERKDKEPRCNPFMIDRTLRGMQIYTKYLPKPTIEPKVDEPSNNPPYMVGRKLRALQIYLKYLPEPIREETPNLLESSSSKPLKIDSPSRDARLITNEKEEFANKSPLNKTNKVMPIPNFDNNHKLPTPKLPLPRVTFTRKIRNHEQKAANSHINNSLSQIEPSVVNHQSPTSKVKNKIRNLFWQSGKEATNTKPLRPQFSPSSRENCQAFQSVNKPSVKNEESKRSQSSGRTRPEVSIKLSAPLKLSNAPNSRIAPATSTSKEDTRLAKNFQGNPKPNIRAPFIAPLKQKTLSPRGQTLSPRGQASIENSFNFSRCIGKPQVVQQELINSKVMMSTGGSASFNFDQERMATTSSNSAHRKLLSDKQREQWVHANDLAQIANKEKSCGFDNQLTNFTTQYNKDVKNALSSLKVEMRKHGFAPHYKINSKLMKHFSNGTYDLKQFTSDSSRSKISSIFPLNSNSISVMEEVETGNNQNFFIETDTATPVEDSQHIEGDVDYEHLENIANRNNT